MKMFIFKIHRLVSQLPSLCICSSSVRNEEKRSRYCDNLDICVVGVIVDSSMVLTGKLWQPIAVLLFSLLFSLVFFRKKLSNYAGAENWNHTHNFVAKRYMEEVEREVYFQDVKLQMDAKLWGEEYSRHNPPKKVGLVFLTVWFDV